MIILYMAQYEIFEILICIKIFIAFLWKKIFILFHSEKFELK